jgi:hypothetical protein
MFARRSIRSSTPLAAALLFAAAMPALAQGRELFEWSGRVDREIQIAMRGNDVWTRRADSRETSRSGSRVRNELPRNEGLVSVRLDAGRGDVQVIQQPSARNNYTTIVRVRDEGNGRDRHRISTYWRPAYSNTAEDYPRTPRVESRDRRDDGDWSWDRGRGRDDDVRRYGGAGRLQWSGRVDNELEIRIRGNDVEYRTLSGRRPLNVSSRLSGRGLTRAAREIRVREESGRGNVYIVQQPSRDNGYTAVLRVRDPQGGYGSYDFDVVWR